MMDFERLNSGIDALIAKIEQLERENTYLRQRESKLLAKTRESQLKNLTTQKRIHRIITRLKNIEGHYEQQEKITGNTTA